MGTQKLWVLKRTVSHTKFGWISEKNFLDPTTLHGTPNFLGPHPLGPWGGGQKFNLSEHGYVAYQT